MIGFHLGVSFLAALLVVVATSLAMILPSAPSALGVFEAAVLVALGAYGISDADALSFALVFHAFNIIPWLVAGRVLLCADSGREVRRPRLGTAAILCIPLAWLLLAQGWGWESGLPSRALARNCERHADHRPDAPRGGDCPARDAGRLRVRRTHVLEQGAGPRDCVAARVRGPESRRLCRARARPDRPAVVPRAVGGRRSGNDPTAARSEDR